MLYKYPGSYAIHGGNFDYVIVDADTPAFELAQSEGWKLTTTEARAQYDADQAAMAAAVDAQGVAQPVAPTKGKKAPPAPPVETLPPPHAW
jgi:hypothetical protein